MFNESQTDCGLTEHSYPGNVRIPKQDFGYELRPPIIFIVTQLQNDNEDRSQNTHFRADCSQIVQSTFLNPGYTLESLGGAFKAYTLLGPTVGDAGEKPRHWH